MELFKKYGENITYNGIKYTIEDFIILLKDNDELYQELRKQALIKTGILPPDIKPEANEQDQG